MATIEYDRVFKKHFHQRIIRQKNLLKKYKQRLELFIKDRHDPFLADHKLVGSLRGTRAFNITGDIRVIYIELAKNHFIFLDIGTHNQVYD